MSRKVSARRTASQKAVQALYQKSFRGQNASQVLQEFVEGWLTPDTDRLLFVRLVETAIAEQETLDQLIAPQLEEEWTMARLDPVLLALLRVAVAELRFSPKTHAAILIHDYIDVARMFFSGQEPGFVNHTLDAIARALRPHELPGRRAPARQVAAQDP